MTSNIEKGRIYGGKVSPLLLRQVRRGKKVRPSIHPLFFGVTNLKLTPP